MRSFKKGEMDICLIPLEEGSPVLGLSYTRIEGKKRTQVNTACFKLQVRKTKGKLVGRVMTYIPDSKFLRNKKNKISELGYELTGTSYSGVCLYSTLDGVLVYGEKYNNGKLLFRFHSRRLSNLLYDQSSVLHSDSTEMKIPKYRIHISLFSGNKATRSVMNYADDESGEVFYCSFCGELADLCTCLVVTPDPDPDPTPPWEFDDCFGCGLPWNFCICCKTCGYYPCTCSWDPNPDPNPSDPNPSNPNPPNPKPESTKFSESKIKETAQKAVDKVLKDHNGDTSKAHCNEGVRNAFNQLFSTKELNNMDANTMTRHWVNNPVKWESVSMDQARQYANDGYFVVVGWINSEGSGHVAVIVPGDGAYRKDWGGTLPYTMDTGADKRWSSKTLNYSFSLGNKDGLLFFKYK